MGLGIKVTERLTPQKQTPIPNIKRSKLMMNGKRLLEITNNFQFNGCQKNQLPE